MKALVTGANGFIGSELVIALDRMGYELRLLSRRQFKNFDTIICNIEKERIPENALESVDIVFHLAGYAHDIDNSKNSEKLYYEVNVNATIELLNISIKKKVKKFIYISSVKAGGSSSAKKILSEIDQINPDNVYGLTKKAAEDEILRIASGSKIDVSIIRPALVYGDNMKGNLAKMLESIRSGWFPPLPETSNMRSMVSVLDLIDAILFINLNQKSRNEIYIVTDGNYYSSREIYEVLCLVSEKQIPRWKLPKVVFYLIASIGNIFRFLPLNSHKYQKLFGNESYSAEKLNELGFVPKYNLRTYFQRNRKH